MGLTYTQARESLNGSLHEVQDVFGETTWVRSMSVARRSTIEDKYAGKGTGVKSAEFRKDLLLQTWANEDGSDFCTAEQLDELFAADGTSREVEKVFERALEVNGFRQKDVERLEKN